jgi:hypothetical protein
MQTYIYKESQLIDPIIYHHNINILKNQSYIIIKYHKYNLRLFILILIKQQKRKEKKN